MVNIHKISLYREKLSIYNRIAMTTLFYFLYKNKKWMKVDNQELYNFAKWVAESNPKLKDETILAINKFIKTYVVSSNYKYLKP